MYRKRKTRASVYWRNTWTSSGRIVSWSFIIIAVIFFHQFQTCVALAFPCSFGAKNEERESIFRAAKTENPFLNLYLLWNQTETLATQANPFPSWSTYFNWIIMQVLHLKLQKLQQSTIKYWWALRFWIFFLPSWTRKELYWEMLGRRPCCTALNTLSLKRLSGYHSNKTSLAELLHSA